LKLQQKKVKSLWDAQITNFVIKIVKQVI